MVKQYVLSKEYRQLLANSEKQTLSVYAGSVSPCVKTLGKYKTTLKQMQELHPKSTDKHY